MVNGVKLLTAIFRSPPRWMCKAGTVGWKLRLATLWSVYVCRNATWGVHHICRAVVLHCILRLL